jgi:hypothetical protein
MILSPITVRNTGIVCRYYYNHVVVVFVAAVVATSAACLLVPFSPYLPGVEHPSLSLNSPCRTFLPYLPTDSTADCNLAKPIFVFRISTLVSLAHALGPTEGGR